MNWDVRFLKEATEDFSRLDGSQQKIVSKALLRVSQNPLPANEGGYGTKIVFYPSQIRILRSRNVTICKAKAQASSRARS